MQAVCADSRTKAKQKERGSREGLHVEETLETVHVRRWMCMGEGENEKLHKKGSSQGRGTCERRKKSLREKNLQLKGLRGGKERTHLRGTVVQYRGRE